MKKRESHTGFRNGKLFCFNCGESYEIKYPLPVSEMNNKIEGFETMHSKCPPIWKAPEADLTKPIGERVKWWTEFGEHGTSSKTIWCVLAEAQSYVSFDYKALKDVLIPPTKYTHPSDPDDFRRCYLLIKAIPEWRERLPELKSISPVWSKLVNNWDKLTEMMEVGIKTGNAPEMYEFMKTLGC